jgi:hypothetical protein
LEDRPVTRLRGHFDGRTVVLDEPVPADLKADTPVEIVVVEDERAKAIQEFLIFMEEFWSRPLSPGLQPSGQRLWKREELYDRGGKTPT